VVLRETNSTRPPGARGRHGGDHRGSNEGSFGHNLTIDELDRSTGTVEPGQVVTATFVVHDGTAKYHCTFHPGMDGEIVAR
jgi:plastocyanin